MPRYEVVLFDADHTLFDFDRAEREALRQTLEEAGLPADGETEARYLSRRCAAPWPPAAPWPLSPTAWPAPSAAASRHPP